MKPTKLTDKQQQSLNAVTKHGPMTIGQYASPQVYAVYQKLVDKGLLQKEDTGKGYSRFSLV